MSFTAPLPVVLVRLQEDQDRCLLVVTRSGTLPRRPINPIEIVGQFALLNGEPDVSVSSFARGKDFTDFLHASIARNAPMVAEVQQTAAAQTGRTLLCH